MNTNNQESFEESECAQALHQIEVDDHDRVWSDHELQLTENKPVKKPMQQPEYPHMTKVRKLCLSMGGSNWDAIFPNTIWTHGGAERMASCLGFLIGMSVSGKLDDAEKLAESLFRSFSFGMKATTVEPNWSERPGMTGPEHTWPHSEKLCVSDDRTTFGFAFCLYGLVDQSSQDPYCVELSGNSYEYGKKYKYGRAFNGGIIFHGLEQVYSVSISGGSGWQMHT